MAMMRRAMLTAAAALAVPAPVRAATRLVVAELFTSQGCSSCPPADAVLAELAANRPDVLALALHVTYWDRLGWRDPYGLEAATRRQRGYAGLSAIGGIYTPQMVVDGHIDVVGSDRPGVLAALARAAGKVPPAPPLHLSRRDGALVATIGAGAGRGQMLLLGFDALHTTAVARGENAGRRLANANVVRTIENLGEWRGTEMQVTAAAPAGERHAVIVQGEDRRILAAGVFG